MELPMIATWQHCSTRGLQVQGFKPNAEQKKKKISIKPSSGEIKLRP